MHIVYSYNSHFYLYMIRVDEKNENEMNTKEVFVLVHSRNMLMIIGDMYMLYNKYLLNQLLLHSLVLMYMILNVQE